MVYTPLIGFTLFMILFLGVAFMLSYFWWADRYKTPEVVMECNCVAVTS